MVRLDAETKQITHAIRMAAYNAETRLARALHGQYARAGDEGYAVIREALTVPLGALGTPCVKAGPGGAGVRESRLDGNRC